MSSAAARDGFERIQPAATAQDAVGKLDAPLLKFGETGRMRFASNVV